VEPYVRTYQALDHLIDFEVLFSIRVLLLLNLSMAKIFSSLDNLLLIGLSGKNNTTQNASSDGGNPAN
jgi:hypothetical protein